MKIKLKSKRVISLVIALVMVSSLAVSVFASASYYYSITTSYKKISLTNSGAAKIYVYKNLKANAPINLSRVSGSKTYVVTIDDPTGKRLVNGTQCTNSSSSFNLTGPAGTYTVWVRNVDDSALNHSFAGWYVDIN